MTSSRLTERNILWLPQLISIFRRAIVLGNWLIVSGKIFCSILSGNGTVNRYLF